MHVLIMTLERGHLYCSESKTKLCTVTVLSSVQASPLKTRDSYQSCLLHVVHMFHTVLIVQAPSTQQMMEIALYGVALACDFGNLVPRPTPSSVCNVCTKKLNAGEKKWWEKAWTKLISHVTCGTDYV